MLKKFFQTLILAVLVLACFAGVRKAEAWSGCGSSYYVQWGDTLFKIAAKCGTSMDAIRQANPGLYNWVYAGQTLRMPSGSWAGSSNTYNGQVFQSSFTYTVARGDTLKIIAARYGTTWDMIARFNGLYNPNIIYVGQRLQIPSRVNYYQSQYNHHQLNQNNQPAYITAQKGDTLIMIAGWFDTSVHNLQLLNPDIPKSNVLSEGMLIRVR